MTDLEPVDSVKKLSGQLAISKVGAVLPENMAQVTELAQYMAKAGEMLPKHLRANPAMCMGVIMDAIAWRMNPFRLATQHMVVNGVGSYMSQAITGIINQNAVIEGRLVPEYQGAGDKRKCLLKPPSRNGQILPYESPEIGSITPKNSPLWKTDPDQQLFYYSARAWCRRYFPELLMGVYDPEEAREIKDITPQPVDNFLHDEPPKREAGPGTATEEVLVESESVRGEFTDEPITPDLIARNIIKAVQNCHTRRDVNEVANENAEALLTLPGPLATQVRKAITDRALDLEA